MQENYSSRWPFRRLLGTLCLMTVGFFSPAVLAAKDRPVTATRLLQAEQEPQNWLTHGRTYNEQRFSALREIGLENVSQLKLAWYHDLPDARGQESTPLIEDGVMYVTSAWSKVSAFNAVTGDLLWRYDPKVPGEWAVHACCDVVNRGAALWGDSVFVGTLDGRLVSLDKTTGKVNWDILTVDPKWPYTITGAPRVVKGKVFIGNGGAEMGVRGYISAYDAESGEMAWRFYTVPGDPSKPFENEILKEAAKTWTGEWWKLGGGGTVWDSMAYDPELDLLYFGVGNGSPWNQKFRSPEGGDNLFLSSIVAVRPDTGEYVWHFQTTPGDEWDYTATQHMILADLKIDGVVRKAIMQAPKNGFFYVLDRETGEYISAEPIIPITWATGVDPKTGRPIEAPNARYRLQETPQLILPGFLGAHNWHPMSYSPDTGLVYIPAQEFWFPYASAEKMDIKTLGANLGIDISVASMPDDPEVKKEIMKNLRGHLAAWDPVAQKEVWRVQHPGAWNGGILSTAGRLVFQGNAKGELVAYNAGTGEQLWNFDAQTGIVAPPVTYSVDGKQYVTVVAGWGGIFPLITGELSHKSGKQRNISRVLTFSLDGAQTLPPKPVAKVAVPQPPELADTNDMEMVAKGRAIYGDWCSACHGDRVVSGGVTPDLRYSAFLHSDAWYQVVLDGILKDRGMAGFSADLSKEDARAVRAYLVTEAQLTRRKLTGDR